MINIDRGPYIFILFYNINFIYMEYWCILIKKKKLNYIILPSGIDKCVFLGYLVFFLGKWIDFENYFIFEYIFEKVIMRIFFFFYLGYF